jgi:uncharacterized protein (TIGR00251 family)
LFAVILRVRVHPRSKREELRLAADGSVEAWTKAPPVEGRANEALCRLLAETAGVPRALVRVVSGTRGRVKVIEIRGVDESEIRSRLAGI